MDQQVDLRTAYLVAFEFLRQRWERGNQVSDELASLLGSMSLLPDGQSADPAITEDWLAAAHAVLRDQREPGGYTAADLTLER